jgi:hypothetical protein
VEGKWKNYHITTFPGQSLPKKTQFGRGYEPVARQILELEYKIYRCLETKTHKISRGNGTVNTFPGNGSVNSTSLLTAA